MLCSLFSEQFHGSVASLRDSPSSHIALMDSLPRASIMRAATIAVLVENESGVLARVIGLFTGRGYNIDSLTVAPVERDHSKSRITIVTSGTEMVIEQIKAQLGRLVPVYRVSDLAAEGPHLARELALIKVVGIGEKRQEALRLADAFRARVIPTLRPKVSSSS